MGKTPTDSDNWQVGTLLSFSIFRIQHMTMQADRMNSIIANLKYSFDLTSPENSFSAIKRLKKSFHVKKHKILSVEFYVVDLYIPSVHGCR